MYVYSRLCGVSVMTVEETNKNTAKAKRTGRFLLLVLDS